MFLMGIGSNVSVLLKCGKWQVGKAVKPWTHMGTQGFILSNEQIHCKLLWKLIFESELFSRKSAKCLKVIWVPPPKVQRALGFQHTSFKEGSLLLPKRNWLHYEERRLLRNCFCGALGLWISWFQESLDVGASTGRAWGSCVPFPPSSQHR